MGRVIAIDPAKKSIAYAQFHDDKLKKCGLIRAETVPDLIANLKKTIRVHTKDTHLIIEVPQIYRQKFWKGDPNDLISVAITCGIVAATLSNITDLQFIRPHAWKGSRPKKVDNARTLSLLKSQEKVIFEKCDVIKSLRHNVLDAIGIGMYYINR